MVLRLQETKLACEGLHDTKKMRMETKFSFLLLVILMRPSLFLAYLKEGRQKTFKNKVMFSSRALNQSKGGASKLASAPHPFPCS